jgi:lipoate-protein ligase A
MRNYNLPDEALLESPEIPEVLVWQPDDIYLILGRSNTAENSIHLDRAQSDGVAILKRPSGGETVLLTPATLVIACTCRLQVFGKPSQFFAWCNRVVITCLNNYGIENLSQKGISDVSYGEQKLLGSAMFKAPDRLFYHAVLNVSELPGTIAWYISHPSREPDYRKGRPHTDFITSLSAIANIPSIHKIAADLLSAFQKQLHQLQ